MSNLVCQFVHVSPAVAACTIPKIRSTVHSDADNDADGDADSGADCDADSDAVSDAVPDVLCTPCSLPGGQPEGALGILPGGQPKAPAVVIDKEALSAKAEGRTTTVARQVHVANAKAIAVQFVPLCAASSCCAASRI